jgi:hypothetical protein
VANIGSNSEREPVCMAAGREESMKKGLHVALDDEEIIELMRILMDDDAEAALIFLKKHFKGKARELLEGG